MGGIDGRRYTYSSLSQSRINSRQRQYMKYQKPIDNSNVDVGKLAFQVLGATANAAMGNPYNPKAWIDGADTGAKIYDFFDNRTFEAKRMAGNQPGDLSGMAYKGPTRIYNN